MKALIATSIIALSSSTAMAGSFAYERQFGTPELFPTLVLEQSATHNAGPHGSTSFAYERQIGTPALFPSLTAEDYETKAPLGEAMVEKALNYNRIWGWDFPVGG